MSPLPGETLPLEYGREAQSLNGIQPNAVIGPVPLKSQNQLHVFEPAAEAGVDGI